MNDQPSAWVLALQRALGLTRSDLAEIAGTGASYINKVLKGSAEPHDDFTAALAELDNWVEASVASANNKIDELTKRQGSEPDDISLVIYPTNTLFRRYAADNQSFGKSKGGFCGPHTVAAKKVKALLDAAGINSCLLAFDEKNYLEWLGGRVHSNDMITQWAIRPF